jgi:hypothetical protein
MDANNTVAVSIDVSPTLTPKKARGRPKGSRNKVSGPKVVKPRFAVVLEDGSLRLLGRGRPPRNVTIVAVTEFNQSALIGSSSPVKKTAPETAAVVGSSETTAGTSVSLDSPVAAVG